MTKLIEGETVDMLMENVYLVRRDIGSFLFHFTKKKRSPARSAADVLRDILSDNKLIGASGPTNGESNCICFTEAPITELAAVFLLARVAPRKRLPPYEPFGVAVTKRWLYHQGGRPVIYQLDSERDLLPQELRYRHVPYDPNRLGEDTSWEREWRVQTDELYLEPAETVVIVPSADDAPYFQQLSAVPTMQIDGEVVPMRWMVVSLDLFGVHEIDY